MCVYNTISFIHLANDFFSIDLRRLILFLSAILLEGGFRVALTWVGVLISSICPVLLIKLSLENFILIFVLLLDYNWCTERRSVVALLQKVLVGNRLVPVILETKFYPYSSFLLLTPRELLSNFYLLNSDPRAYYYFCF